MLNQFISHDLPGPDNKHWEMFPQENSYLPKKFAFAFNPRSRAMESLSLSFFFMDSLIWEFHQLNMITWFTINKVYTGFS
jgi:hypothetical protein